MKIVPALEANLTTGVGRKMLKRITCIGLCLIALALGIGLGVAYFHSTVIACPNCRTARRAIFLSREQKTLLEWKAELKMGPRVEAFYRRGGFDRLQPFQRKDWREEDRVVYDYIAGTFNDPFGRLRLIARKVAQLEKELGDRGILCPDCHDTELEIHDKNVDTIWP